MSADVVVGADGIARCAWATGSLDYLAYHDREWGRAVHGDAALYERLTLEAFQSGLSWLTILRKREAFRRAFAAFDPDVVAGYTEADVARLLGDAGIVRNRAKVTAAITNARALRALRHAEGEEHSTGWCGRTRHHGVVGPGRAPPRTCPPGPRSPRRWRPGSSGAASSSWGRPPRTRRCRPAASSTTTSPAVPPPR